MAAPVPTLQTLVDDAQRVLVKIVVPGGGDADAASVAVIDISTYTGGSVTPTTVILERLWYSMHDMAIALEWAATANVDAVIVSGDGAIDFRKSGELVNNAGSGVTGDIDLSTVGYDATGGSGGFIIVQMKKVV